MRMRYHPHSETRPALDTVSSSPSFDVLPDAEREEPRLACGFSRNHPVDRHYLSQAMPSLSRSR